MKATGGLFVKSLPSFMLIGMIILATVIMRAFPTWSTITRVCVRLVGWPLLQVVGAGMLRQATVLGGGSERAAKMAIAITLNYQGKKHHLTCILPLVMSHRLTRRHSHTLQPS